MQEWLDAAIDAARQAGGLQRSRFAGVKTVTHKGAKDLVTDVDLASERIIIACLNKACPDFGVLAEEGGSHNEQHEYCWIIDPLDGTTNYAHGYPWFCVSIALAHRAVPLLSVIYNPMSDELFTARHGAGAWCNGHQLTISQTTELGESLLATGFPYDCATSQENNFDDFMAFQRRAQGIRRAGSAALDLAYVAKGSLDGFWEIKLKPWDVAAGILLVQEAGGMVTGHAGEPFLLENHRILASNGYIHASMVTLLTSGESHL